MPSGPARQAYMASPPRQRSTIPKRPSHDTAVTTTHGCPTAMGRDNYWTSYYITPRGNHHRRHRQRRRGQRSGHQSTSPPTTGSFGQAWVLNRIAIADSPLECTVTPGYHYTSSATRPIIRHRRWGPRGGIARVAPHTTVHHTESHRWTLSPLFQTSQLYSCHLLRLHPS